MLLNDKETGYVLIAKILTIHFGRCAIDAKLKHVNKIKQDPYILTTTILKFNNMIQIIFFIISQLY